MQVIDASALAEALLNRPAGAQVLASLHDDPHAPDLVIPECLSVLRGWGLGGHASWARLDQAVEDLLAMPMVLWPMSPLVPRSWSLRHNVSSYDSMYIALAESLDAELVTCDGPLSRAVPPSVSVRYIAAG